jgi:hypothetical protein
VPQCLPVTGQPVEGFGQNHDVEARILGIREKRLYPRPKGHAGTGDCGVGIALHDLPAFALRTFTTQSQLILYRGLPLSGRKGLRGSLPIPCQFCREFALPFPAIYLFGFFSLGASSAERISVRPKSSPR